MTPTFKPIGNNELVPMTRRYPNLPKKVLQRDSKITKRIMMAWDVDGDPEKVLAIFLKERRMLSHERYWELMRSVWIIAGSVENSELFRKLMQANRRSRYFFSTPEEAKKLRELPDTFNVFRATNDSADGGLSWTLSKQYAEHYKQEFDKEMIVMRKVNKSDVFAYIERNNESEIIIL